MLLALALAKMQAALTLGPSQRLPAQVAVVASACLHVCTPVDKLETSHVMLEFNLIFPYLRLPVAGPGPAHHHVCVVAVSMLATHR